METNVIYKGLELGEGCLWDKERNLIHFLDISKFKIHSYSPISKEINTIDVGNYVGCIVLDEDNNIIACVKDTVYKIDFETGEKTPIIKIEQDDNLRFNDGKCDQYGNLWVGTMMIDNPNNEMGKGSFYCIKGDKIIAKYDNFTIPNGLAWKNNKLYHIDTPTKNVYCYDIENECNLLNKKIAIHFDEVCGAPDGMCMDSLGNLWIAIWGGSKVVCFNTETKEKIDEIILDTACISCCTFAGENLNDMYITSASDNADASLYHVNLGKIHGTESFRFKLK